MKKNKNNKIKRLILMCCLSSILLVASTYAWFIGMKNVTVSQFDIKIAATEGLELSVDGKTWYNDSSTPLDAKNATAYVGNTNTWAEGGLIPMSTVGDTDASKSEMILFEKASLTATKGGYRLLASRVNYPATGADDLKEGKGYVAFDLFIRNISGEEYYQTNNVANEEAIYLTNDSKVTISKNGGIAGTGIENSVRVGFVQIGRVEQQTATEDQITSIKCADVKDDEGNLTTTSICRTATIWEPNNTAHVQNAINWYEEACQKRIYSTTVDDIAYDLETKCKTVVNGTENNTYAIANELEIEDYVDVYDGADYNYLSNNTVDSEVYYAGEDKSDYKLVDMDYFTDTENLETGVNRPEIMTLAPNSITKVRVYVWIEGQDVDNYDFSSLGGQVSVNFGFTKERFEQSEIITE